MGNRLSFRECAAWEEGEGSVKSYEECVEEGEKERKAKKER